MTNPEDAFRVEPVDGLVEHHRRRISEQRRRNPKPLTHPERELSRPLFRHLVKSDQVDQLVNAPAVDPVRLRQRKQMVVGGATRMNRARLEQRPDLVQRRRVVAVVPPVDGHVAGGRRVELEDQPHRGRLPGPVRPEEAGDHSRLNRERQVVDSSLLAVVLRQAFGHDHGRTQAVLSESFLR